VRLLAFHEATRDPATIERHTVELLPPAVRDSAAVRGASARFFSTFAAVRYGVKSDRAADLARAKILAAFDRLEAELDGRPYLVGERFSVADLTAASLLYPMVQPPESPRLPPPPEAIERFRAPLKERPGYK
jgi:glutathione S-transferase